MKNTKKRSHVTRIAFIVAILTLVTSVGLSSTLAKYVSEIVGEDNVRVAKFDVSSNGSTTLEAVYDTNPGNLDTYLLADDFSNVATLFEEAEVEKASTGAKIIAPGTWGLLQIKADNNSEVDVSVGLKNISVASGTKVTFTISEVLAVLNATDTANKQLANDLKARITAAGWAGTKSITLPLQIGYVESGAVNWNFVSDTFTATPPFTTYATLKAKETDHAIGSIFWKWEFESANEAASGTLTAAEANDLIDTIFGYLATAEIISPISLNFNIEFVQID